MDDTISKKAVLVAVKDALMAWSYMTEWRDEKIIKAIAEMPPAEQKRGKWKNIVDGIEYTWGTCDSCGARIPMPYKYYKYCPNCGADMRGDKNA